MSDEILNSKGVSGIRFRMAKPQGYFTEDIEAFIDGPLKQTLAAYELKTSQQESTITRLENRITELDSKVAELELRNSFQESSMNVQSDDALMASLEQQERLEKENQAYKIKLQEIEGELAAMRISLKEKDQYANELDAYIDKIQPMLKAGAKALQQSGEYQEVEEPKVNNSAMYESLQTEDAYAEDLIEEYEEQPQEIKEVQVVEKGEQVITENVTSDNFDFFNLDAEVDLEEIKDELDEALAKEEAEELEEYDILPDGTKVPKGIRPEDL